MLQPEIAGSGNSEGSVTPGAWTELANGLRQSNYVFSGVPPAQFSARIAPQLVGLGLLDAVTETLFWSGQTPAMLMGPRVSPVGRRW